MADEVDPKGEPVGGEGKQYDTIEHDFREVGNGGGGVERGCLENIY